MYSTSEFRNGLKIEIDGDAYIITDFQHVKPGKGNAFVRTKMKNLQTGAVLERTFKSGEKIDKPDIEERRMQYLYKDDTFYHFMDLDTYDQIQVGTDRVGDSKAFLKENLEITALFHNGRAIAIDVPNHVVLEIARTEPGVKGDTATGATKPATLETGHVILVPLFLDEGNHVRIDTRTGLYIERA